MSNVMPIDGTGSLVLHLQGQVSFSLAPVHLEKSRTSHGASVL